MKMSKQIVTSLSKSEGTESSASLDWNQSNHLVSTSFNDNKVNIWEVNGSPTPKMMLSYEHEKPVLDACFGPGGMQIISGGKDGTVLLFDIDSQSIQQLGDSNHHQQPVRTVTTLSTLGLVATGGVDGIVNVWDLRAPLCPVHILKHDFQCPITCSVTHGGDKLFIASLDRKVHILDFRKPEQRVIDEALDSTIRCMAIVKCSTGKPLLGVGSHKGEVFFRTEKGRIRTLRPQLLQRNGAGATSAKAYQTVNSICSDDTNGRFATGGDAGLLEIWKDTSSGADYDDDSSEATFVRKKMIHMQRPITAVKFNMKGDLLACSLHLDNNCAVVPCIHKVPILNRSPRRNY